MNIAVAMRYANSGRNRREVQMSYDYQMQKAVLFTDAGQRQFLMIRDKAEKCIKLAGAVRSQELLIGGGDSWNMLACVDRLVELNYLREIHQNNAAGQHHVFVAGSAWQ